MSDIASNLPVQLGKPCWSAAAVGKAISAIARMSPELEPYFISTHSPNERLRDVKRGGELSEADLYERLLTPERRNAFVIVRGDPGTGKSHLIRWLHLRCTLDIAAERLPNVLAVLVQRRTGSLKDALTQIVEQLPPRFERHLRQIKDAIGNLSEERARQALAGALQLQLVDAPELPPTLRHLHVACLSPDFRRWLIRPDGVIDRIVRQLTQESDVVDRESLPQFTADDFRPPRAYQVNNAPSTQDLIEDLDYLPDLREQAAALFNAAARPAVKAMSGLIGSGLRDVFDAIRRELGSEKRRLALFIEDVSVMAALDDDILNAVEPNPAPDLGELVAVVGMTDTGFAKLPENLVGRTTEIVGVGLDVAAQWRESPAGLARFSARYLNVARLTDAGTRSVAASRLRGTDVTVSACSACTVREVCHATFGFVAFEGVDVGLFPFTKTALHTLFGGLNERMPAVRKNPRGLLEHVLTPILRDDRTSLLDGAFPRAQLAVDIDEPPYWSGFASRYLGGWSTSEQNRLRSFAQSWIRAVREDEAARELQPFLSPLGFSTLSAMPVDRPPPPPNPRRQEDREHPRPELPQPYMEPETLRAVRNDMSRWAGGEQLSNDEVPRGLLLDFLRNGIAWDDERVPVRVYDKLLKNKSHVRFEDQRSRLRAGQTFAFEVARGEDARALIEALARWKWVGRESWNFEGGQRSRRAASRWLRTNKDQVICSLLPPEPLGRGAAIEHAVRVLAAVAILRRGSDHPPDRPGVVRELLQALPNDRPEGISAEDQRAVELLWMAHPKAREFVLGELSAPQGGTRGGTIFIDPRPIVEYADSVHRLPKAAPLNEAYTQGNHFWQTCYATLQGTEATADLTTLFDARRTGYLQVITRTIRPALIDTGLDTEKLEDGVADYCAQIAALLPLQAATFPRSHPELDAYQTAFGPKGKAWAQTLAAAQRVATTEGVVGLLSVSPLAVEEAARAIATAHEFLRSLEAELNASERRLVADGDPDVLRTEIAEMLREVAAIDETASVDPGTEANT